MESERTFPYRPGLEGVAGPALAYLPLTLGLQEQQHHGVAMIDSGSMVSVLPYQVGLKLGGKWGAGKPLKLTGNLARLPAFPLLLKASIEGFDPVALAFAWTLFEDAPLLLGQMNFFSLFDVSFSGSRQTLRLKRSTVATLLPLP